MKLCKDCRYMVPDPQGRNDDRWAECMHPSSEIRSKPSPVTGLAGGTSRETCRWARMFAAMVTGRDDGCGPEAKFFEPKESPGRTDDDGVK